MQLKLAIAASSAVALLFALPSTSTGTTALAVDASHVAPRVELFSLAVRKESSIAGATLFESPGVELKFAVQVPGASLLSIDEKASVMRSFKDDAKTDLAAGLEDSFFHWAQMGYRFDEEEHMDVTTITIATAALPAKAATRIELDATVVVIDAQDPKDVQVPIALKKGTKFSIGAMELEVSDVESEEWGDVVLRVDLSSSAPLDALRGLDFHDADGLVAKDDMGSSSFGFGGKMTYTKSYGLYRKLENATIHASYWGKLTPVEIPIKASAGVGL